MSYSFNNQITVSEALQGLDTDAVVVIFKRYTYDNYERIALPALAELRRRDAYLDTASAMVHLLNSEDAEYLRCGAPFTRLVALELQKFRHTEKSAICVLEYIGQHLVDITYQHGIEVLAMAEGDALFDWIRQWYRDCEKSWSDKVRTGEIHADEVRQRAEQSLAESLGEDPFNQVSQYVKHKKARLVSADAGFRFKGSWREDLVFHANGRIVQTVDGT